MTETAASLTTERSSAPGAMPAGELFISRVRLTCALAVAAMIFWYVGWWAVRPYDPQGPISLLLVNQGVFSMAKLLGLAVVTSGLAVAICGAGTAERGPLAIAVGLASLGLRGWEMDRLVLFYRTEGAAGSAATASPFPAWELVAECWLWLALIAVGFVVGRWVESWYTPSRPAPPTDRSSDLRQGVGTIAVTALVAWVVLVYTVGNEVDPIFKGQIYFSVIIAFLIGGLVSHAILRTTSRIWGLVAIPIVVTAAYRFGSPDDTTLAEIHRAYINIKPVARPLPLEFAALGSIGILIEADGMRWLRAMFGLSTAERPA